MSKELDRAEMEQILRDIRGPVSAGSGANDWLISTTRQINAWLERGDGVAVYRNEDFNSPDRGSHQIASYGSPAAMLETDEPPTTLPDMGGAINWRYQLFGTYRGEALAW